MSGESPPTVAFVLEQTLGHVTHADNIRSLVPNDPRIEPLFCPIEYAVSGLAARLPGYSNWTVRAGLRTRRALGRLWRANRFDALFVHTQVPAVLAKRWLSRVPAVVSIDATPIQYDIFGAQYAHQPSSAALERLKWRLNRDTFAASAHVVSWSHWSKASLVDDYEVDPDKVTVIPPGVDVSKWTTPVRAGDRELVKILFVGGDLQRKGGSLLIDAVKRLRRGGPHREIELHLATGADVADEPGIVVHRGLRPNTPELIALYHDADIFCLPTLGDCLPMVLSEAGAAGLPLVATGVGAVKEIVQDGVTGVIVETGSVDSLVAALATLVDDVELRRRMGENARALVEAEFDAVKNCGRLVDLLESIAGQVRRS